VLLNRLLDSPPAGDGTCPIIVVPDGIDHLYRECPRFRRESIGNEPKQLDCSCRDRCDPLDDTVCNWCRRVWRARHRLKR